jgi:hypothetical protein
MRTALKSKVFIENLIPRVTVTAFELPGDTNVICLQFQNHDNPDIPRTGLQHALLVPDGARVQKLDEDYTAYPIPADHDEINIVVSIGIISDRDYLAAQMTIRSSADEDRVHTHISCELN